VLKSIIKMFKKEPFVYPEPREHIPPFHFETTHYFRQVFRCKSCGSIGKYPEMHSKAPCGVCGMKTVTGGHVAKWDNKSKEWKFPTEGNNTNQ